MSRTFQQIKELRAQGKIQLSDRALKILEVLKKSMDELVVLSGSISGKIMAELQHAAGVEFALIRKGHQRILVRGKINEVFIPKGTTKIIAHTHAGVTSQDLLPSRIDKATIIRLKQKSSLIINELAKTFRFRS
jgi:hypothetical protein